MSKKAKKKATAKKKAKKAVKKATKKHAMKEPVKKKKATKQIKKKTTKKKNNKTSPSTTPTKTTKKIAVKKTPSKKPKLKASKKVATPKNGLRVGDIAPGFTMETDTHGKIRLSDYKGKSNVLLYFYPKDDTPGCTVQACTFQKSENHYSDANVTVIGVSPDNIASHQKFRSKYGLGFTLASDPDHSVCEAYGVWVLKNNYGKEYMGVQRSTFLIAKNGKIAAVWSKVKVEGHDAEVQQAIALLS
jgi:peroxiredoxin Q/BCP